MRRLLVAAMLVLAGCGSGSVAGQGDHGYRLFVERMGSSGVDVITTSPAIRVSLPAGFLTADGTQLYGSGGQVFGGASGPAGVTKVDIFDTSTGALARKVEVAGSWTWDGGGTSPDGRWLVLTASQSATSGNFLVLDTGITGKQYPVSLGGHFNFDAISNDGRHLYLIETLAGSAYRVRVYDVLAKTLQPGAVLIKGPEVEAMNGYKITAVADPIGHMLYSLYGRNDGRPPFVHALDLEAGIAFCIDLPAIDAMKPTYANAGSSGWALSLDYSDHRLYASSSLGQLIAIDTNQNSVVRSAAISAPAVTSLLLPFVVDVQAKEYDARPAASAVDPAGRWLYIAWESGFLTVDTTSLRPVALRDRGDVLSSLAISPDGRHLFGVIRFGVLADLNPQTGNRQATIADVATPWRILRVEAIP